MSTVKELLNPNFFCVRGVDIFVHSKSNYTVWPNVYEHIFILGLGFLLDEGAYV